MSWSRPTRALFLGWLAFLCVRTRLFLAPTWFDGTLEYNHELLLRGQYFNNEQSRPLQYLLPELLRRVAGLSVPHCYAVVHFLLLWASLTVMERLGRRLCAGDEGGADEGGEHGMLCAAILAVVLPFSYVDHLQESSGGLLLTVLLGMLATLARRRGALMGVVGLGALNNESVLALPALWALARGLEEEPRRWPIRGLEALMIGLPGLLVQGSIRALTRDNAHLTEPWQLQQNLARIGAALPSHPADWFVAEDLHLFFLLGPLLALSLRGWSRRPALLRAAVLWAPLYVLPNLITGIVGELRLFVPVAATLLPAALWGRRAQGRP